MGVLWSCHSKGFNAQDSKKPRSMAGLALLACAFFSALASDMRKLLERTYALAKLNHRRAREVRLVFPQIIVNCF
jgi:hypothetical protein